MMASWFYMEGGKAAGPVEETELAALASAGRISGSTSIRGADEQAWSRLDVRLPQIAETSPASSPPPPEAPAGSRWIDTKARPWRRYFARMIDGAIFGTLAIFVFFFLLAAIAPASAQDFAVYLAQPGGRMIGVMLSVVLLIPLNTVLVGSTGFTLGKWIFGVRVLRLDGRPIGLFDAFNREIEVWVRGLAIGLPLVSLVTMVICYRSLERNKFAPWDYPTSRVVVHRASGLVQTLMSLAGVALLIAVVAGATLLS